MITKTQKIRLGVFIAVGSMLILLFAGVVAGSTLFQKKDLYYIKFEDTSVSGLQVGGAVEYHGIKVGRVETIKINPKDVTTVILTISLDAGTPIKKDVNATLIYVGITGLKSVELNGGSNQAPLLKPKSYIPAGISTLESITGRAESIAEKIDQIASNISSLTNADNQKNLAGILKQSNLLLSDTRESLSETLNSLNIIAENASDLAGSTSSSLHEITENTSLVLLDTRTQIKTIGEHTDQLILQAAKDMSLITGNINQSLSRINQVVNSAYFDSLIVNANTISGKLASADLRQLVTDLNATIVQTNNLVGNLDRTVVRGKSDILETLESLREAADNLNEFSKQISENPSSLFIGNRGARHE